MRISKGEDTSPAGDDRISIFRDLWHYSKVNNILWSLEDLARDKIKYEIFQNVVSSLKYSGTNFLLLKFAVF
jgi:hypothetical protein